MFLWTVIIFTFKFHFLTVTFCLFSRVFLFPFLIINITLIKCLLSIILKEDIYQLDLSPNLKNSHRKLSCGGGAEKNPSVFLFSSRCSCKTSCCIGSLAQSFLENDGQSPTRFRRHSNQGQV